MECFLSLFLMLNSSLIKNLLHKPAEIQWNITKTLPGKLKRKISWSFFYKILPPEITKMCKIAIFAVLWGPGNQCGTPWLFTILWVPKSFSLNILVKNSFNFKLRFFTYFEYISEGIIRKNILRSDYHSTRWYWCKKNPEKSSTNFT